MSLESSLRNRSHSQCELCSANNNLVVYNVPPVNHATADNSILVCDLCKQQIESTGELDANHWRCLNESMWSEVGAVQVMAWRLLKRFPGKAWAMDLLDQLFLDEEHQKWAQSHTFEEETAEKVSPTKDSNGNVLVDGDSVTLIKDLEVKGANFTAKRGTLVKNISLTSNPEHIEGRVNGTQIVLLTCFLKKV